MSWEIKDGDWDALRAMADEATRDPASEREYRLGALASAVAEFLGSDPYKVIRNANPAGRLWSSTDAEIARFIHAHLRECVEFALASRYPPPPSDASD